MNKQLLLPFKAYAVYWGYYGHKFDGPELDSIWTNKEAAEKAAANIKHTDYTQVREIYINNEDLNLSPEELKNI